MIVQKFDQLMSHLNGEDNEMAEKFREELVKVKEDADKYQCLRDAGVDNWSGYADAMDDEEEDY